MTCRSSAVPNCDGKRWDLCSRRSILFRILTALENVQVPLFLAGETQADQQERATGLLEKVGLAERMDHKPSELSTGQQQRVALARTLANDPDLILADEPTGNLDPASRQMVLSFFEQFQPGRKDNRDGDTRYRGCPNSTQNTELVRRSDPRSAGRTSIEISLTTCDVQEIARPV